MEGRLNKRGKGGMEEAVARSCRDAHQSAPLLSALVPYRLWLLQIPVGRRPTRSPALSTDCLAEEITYFEQEARSAPSSDGTLLTINSDTGGIR